MFRLITEKSFFSGLIRWYTNSDWSHVDIALPDDGFLGARLNGGVKIRPRNYIVPSRVLWMGITLTTEKETEFYKWAKEQIGKPYDLKAVLSFAFDKNWRQGNSWFCSMLVYAALEHVGYPPLRLQYASKCTPADLAMSLALNVWRDK